METVRKISFYYRPGFMGYPKVLRWFTAIVVAIHVGLALAILIGGKPRFSLPSYEPLVSYTGGNVWIWGVWIGASALFMASPIKGVSVIGLWLGMCWHIIWMSCFTIAVVNYATAAATPIPIYGGLAFLNATLLTVRVIDKT